MRPEEIDKLFGDRLKNTSPAPPADLWNRLQERIETEMPETKLQIKPEAEEKKKSFVWVYSSVAATLSLLLATGLIFYNLNTGTPEVQEIVAVKEEPVLVEEPVFTAPAVTEPATLAQADKISEEKSKAQATAKANLASKHTEADTKAESHLAKAETRKANMNTTTRSTTLAITDNTNTGAVVTEEPVSPTVVVIPEMQPVTVSSLAAASKASEANLNAETVEITIKRAIASQPASAPEPEPGGLTKKASLAKNIFKQVRNLSNGDPVELASIVGAEKISLKTQIGKQKFTKVINL